MYRGLGLMLLWQLFIPLIDNIGFVLSPAPEIAGQSGVACLGDFSPVAVGNMRVKLDAVLNVYAWDI